MGGVRLEVDAGVLTADGGVVATAAATARALLDGAADVAAIATVARILAGVEALLAAGRQALLAVDHADAVVADLAGFTGDTAAAAVERIRQDSGANTLATDLAGTAVAAAGQADLARFTRNAAGSAVHRIAGHVDARTAAVVKAGGAAANAFAAHVGSHAGGIAGPAVLLVTAGG
jgi:hypothetical protein